MGSASHVGGDFGGGGGEEPGTPPKIGCRWTGCKLFGSGCDGSRAGIELHESRSCGFMRGTNSLCCSRADEAAARWEEGARWAEDGNEDACFNRCPRNARCNAKTKSCVCDIGYFMQGIECMSVKEGQEDLPLPGEVREEGKVRTDRERAEDYDDPALVAERRRERRAGAAGGAADVRGAGRRRDGDEEGRRAGRRFGAGAERPTGSHARGLRLDRGTAIKVGLAVTVMAQAAVVVALMGGRVGVRRVVRRVQSRLLEGDEERQRRTD